MAIYVGENSFTQLGKSNRTNKGNDGELDG